MKEQFMSQGFSNQRLFGPMVPSQSLSRGDRFEMIPGRVGHFLESGYTFAGSSANLPEDSQIDLESYHIVLIPKDLAIRHTPHANVSARSDQGFLILSRHQLVSQLQSACSASVVSARLNSDYAEFGDIRVDFRSIEVRRNNRLVQLSAMEFKVLKFFISHPDRVISRDELLNEVWGYTSYPCTRTVDNHVLRLRHKLEPDFSNPVYLRTAPGFGYRFTPASSDPSTSPRNQVTRRRSQ
jgi:DNA-binding winged helix-turn-helix (wHTH) protein